jgi:hypothetical protein
LQVSSLRNHGKRNASCEARFRRDPQESHPSLSCDTRKSVFDKHLSPLGLRERLDSPRVNNSC